MHHRYVALMVAVAALFLAFISMTTETLPDAFTNASAVHLHLETSLLFWPDYIRKKDI
jgi:hypothetical protein